MFPHLKVQKEAYSFEEQLNANFEAIRVHLARIYGMLGPVNLQCKPLHPDAKLPAKAGELEVGWDICCVADDSFYTVVSGWVFSDEEKWIGNKCDYFGHLPTCVAGDKLYIMKSNREHLFHTGFACAIDPGFSMLFWDRSGMGGKKQIHRLAGAIDCTYRGEWLVELINLSDKTHIIKAGDKIVQGILTPVLKGIVNWTDTLPDSARGTAGFGSSGR